MSRQKTNWNRIKKEFLSDQTTYLKDVATKHGISYGYLRKISMREGWVAEKRWLWKKIDKKAMEMVEDLITEKYVRYSRQALEESQERNN